MSVREKYPLNHEVVDEDKKYIAKAQKTPYFPLAIKEGNGALIYDYDGNEYIDFLSSASSANTGHGDKEIAEAVKNQMEKMSQYTIAYMYCKEAVDLAKKLVGITPGDFEKKVLFSNCGSESNDGAIKLARAYTGRSKIISFFESYHGATYGALSMTQIAVFLHKGIGPLLPEFYQFNYPLCYRCKYGKDCDNCSLECLDEVKYAFNTYISSDEVAAIFLEPITGDSGIHVPPIKYVKALAQLCKEHGILLAVDEIQQGLGRTGKWFSIEHFGVEPDLITMGKSLGAGLPMGAIIGRAEIMDSIDGLGHVFSLAGNSACSVAALKNIEIIERENLLARSTELGEYFVEKLTAMKDKYDIIGNIRGKGLSIGVDLVKSRETKEKNGIAAAKICNRCIENGLVQIFISGSTLRIQPPLVITKEQIDKGLAILEESIQAFMDGKISDEVLLVTKGW